MKKIFCYTYHSQERLNVQIYLEQYIHWFQLTSTRIIVLESLYFHLNKQEKKKKKKEIENKDKTKKTLPMIVPWLLLKPF